MPAKTFYSIWSEWDFGFEGLLFPTRDAALQHIKDDENVQDFLEDESQGYETVEDIIADGMLGFEEEFVVE